MKEVLIPEDWMNDPFFTGSDTPIPDDWYNDPFFKDDTDKPTDDDLLELEPFTDDEGDSSPTPDKDKSEPSRTKDKDDKDLLKEIDKWLDFGIKQVDRIVDVAKGNRPKEKVKIATFDDIKITVPTEKKQSAETIFSRYRALSVEARKQILEKIRDRGDLKDTGWIQVNVQDVKESDVKIDKGYTPSEVFNEYLALSQDQRWRFIKMIDESEQAFTIDLDPHTEVLDSVQKALKAHE